jgi:hypothetical protein
MKLSKLKFADVQKLAVANEAAEKASKEGAAKLADAQKSVAAAEQAVEAESKELESTDE